MNRLDKFIPFLLDRVQLARSKGIPEFQIRHATGDRIVVKLTNGSIYATRYVRDASIVLVKLATTEAQLRQDMKTGITSKQAELFRG